MPKIDLYRKIDEKYCSKRNADIRVGIPSLQYRNELNIFRYSILLENRNLWGFDSK